RIADAGEQDAGSVVPLENAPGPFPEDATAEGAQQPQRAEPRQDSPSQAQCALESFDRLVVGRADTEPFPAIELEDPLLGAMLAEHRDRRHRKLAGSHEAKREAAQQQQPEQSQRDWGGEEPFGVHLPPVRTPELPPKPPGRLPESERRD